MNFTTFVDKGKDSGQNTCCNTGLNLYIMKPKFLLLLFIFLIINPLSAQQTYYVDQQNGNDMQDGLSPATAFENINTAVVMAQPGDSIAIIGTYHNTGYNPDYVYNNAPDDPHIWHAENSIKINDLNGNTDAYITIKAYDANTKILGDGANIIRLVNCSYLRIEGLNIEGEVNRIPLDTALALQFLYIIADNNMTGTPAQPDISDIHYRNLDEINDDDGIVEATDIYTNISALPVRRPSYTDTRGLYLTNCEHIIITGNTLHHTPGVGLRVANSKYIDILENEIYRCSARSYSGTHALVVAKTKPIGYSGNSIVIERNSVHHNYNEIFSWTPQKTFINPRIDEGKGISLQQNDRNNWVNGQGRIWVANNICYWNGYSGIHSNDGERIDFINNTCFMNSYTNTVTYADDTPHGNNIGISCQRGNDIRIINNISVIDSGWGGFALSAGSSTNLEVKNNLVYGTNGALAYDPDITDLNSIEQDPLFTQAPTAYWDETYGFDFHLTGSSPAIDRGNTGSYVPDTDFYKHPRDAHPDIGAVEVSTTYIKTTQQKKLSLFPNPTGNTVYIKGTNLPMRYTIFDTSGRILGKGKVRNGKIHLHKWPVGVYLIKIANRYYKFVKRL